MVDHLAGLLRRFGLTERTMVFCVDMAHAQLVAQLLNDAFGELGLEPYAVPIVVEEGDAPAWLASFQDSDRKTPVMATTAELLSTGVDVPSCRNIVFMKALSPSGGVCQSSAAASSPMACGAMSRLAKHTSRY